jgi:hypothetical protein
MKRRRENNHTLKYKISINQASFTFLKFLLNYNLEMFSIEKLLLFLCSTLFPGKHSWNIAVNTAMLHLL